MPNGSEDCSPTCNPRSRNAFSCSAVCLEVKSERNRKYGYHGEKGKGRKSKNMQDSDEQKTFRDKETACVKSSSSKAGDELSSLGPIKPYTTKYIYKKNNEVKR